MTKHREYKGTHRAWQQIGREKLHGINVPLFSLRGESGGGIGNFYDLIPIIEWCAKIGYRVIQLLPINDSGPDSSPYNALSAVAINPIYLNLESLDFLNEELRLEIRMLGRFNTLQRIAYTSVLAAKLDILRLYFQINFHHIEKDPKYEEFIEKHPFFKHYALFKALKEHYVHRDWQDWHPHLSNPSKHALKEAMHTHREEMNFHLMLQFLCYQQLKVVKNNAEKHQIFLKGDIPILISPQSMDVWLYRENFNLDYSAGAPPDYYSSDGQNWGFPIYNWEAIEENHFSWWETRLHYAANFYDLYRIDHVIGFFRIWAIAEGQKATGGIYLPKEKWAYLEQGRRILGKLCDFTEMLPIAEDLGTVPEGSREVLFDLKIPGTRVPRWEKRLDRNKSFIPFEDYAPLSLTTVSTHDSATLRLFWEEETDVAKAYAHFRNWAMQPWSRELQYQLLKDGHQTRSQFHINLLQEYLALYEDLSWPNAHQERINIPGTVSTFNWSYRFRPSVREIVNHDNLALTMQQLIKK